MSVIISPVYMCACLNALLEYIMDLEIILSASYVQPEISKY